MASVRKFIEDELGLTINEKKSLWSNCLYFLGISPSKSEESWMPTK